MKKAVAFLLAFLIFVAPMTTLVKADVVIGDNDNIIVNENAKTLGRKMAIMESFSDLLLSGVTEFTISNTNNVDDYIDNLWTEINNAIDSLNDGTGFQEISNNLKSKYIYNLMNYRDYINNRGDYLSYTLQNPSTNLLQTYFADNIYGKIETTHYDLALDMFRSLSNLTQDSSGNPDPNYAQYVNKMNGHNPGQFFWYNAPQLIPGYKGNKNIMTYPFTGYSWIKWPFTDANIFPNGGYRTQMMYCTNIIDLYIFSDGTNYIGSVNNLNPIGVWMDGAYQMTGIDLNYDEQTQGWYMVSGNNAGFSNYSFTYSNPDLGVVLDYFASHIKNANLYVDGVPWSIVGPSNNPTLDIDGFIKIYGNDNPQQYYLPENTKIDYDELYQVIYNAIHDNLPISQGDVTYYDSHDTIYSPTIINNYGDEEGDESDLIDTILDYAVIPKFDTAIAQPMRQALTNGVLVMNNSITNVIPNEILLILGACFFLLLFAVVINRMIK